MRSGRLSSKPGSSWRRWWRWRMRSAVGTAATHRLAWKHTQQHSWLTTGRPVEVAPGLAGMRGGGGWRVGLSMPLQKSASEYRHVWCMRKIAVSRHLLALSTFRAKERSQAWRSQTTRLLRGGGCSELANSPYPPPDHLTGNLRGRPPTLAGADHITDQQALVAIRAGLSRWVAADGDRMIDLSFLNS